MWSENRSKEYKYIPVPALSVLASELCIVGQLPRTWSLKAPLPIPEPDWCPYLSCDGGRATVSGPTHMEQETWLAKSLLKSGASPLPLFSPHTVCSPELKVEEYYLKIIKILNFISRKEDGRMEGKKGRSKTTKQ